MWTVRGEPIRPTRHAEVLGQELVQRHHQDMGFPAVAGATSLLLGTGLLVGAWAWMSVSMLLSVLALGMGGVAIYGGSGLVRDFITRWRFNQRELTVTYGLREVSLRDAEGERVLSLAEGVEHELANWVPPQIKAVLEARQGLTKEPAESPLRLALEFAAMHRHEDGWGSHSYIVVRDETTPLLLVDAEWDAHGQAAITRGDPVYHIQTSRVAGAWRPSLQRRGIQRQGRSARWA